MAIPYAAILARISVKIGDLTDEAEEKLDFVNDKLFEINSIDFCNPLGYIMGKALPPQGPVQKSIDKYAGKLKKFVDKIGSVDLKEKALNRIDETAGTTEEQLQRRQETIDALLEIKREIDQIVVPPEFIENIPGADKIAAKLQKLKISLDIAEGIAVDSFTISDIPGVQTEIQALKTFLLPFTNPINAINTFFADEVADVNKVLKDFIRPDKLADDVEKIIQTIVAIEKILQSIIALLQMINMIIKLCNILIRIYIILAKLLKKLPIPARWQTTGNIVKAADKANEMEHHKAKELLEFLGVLSAFIDSVLVSLSGVRDEIITMIVALEQLKQNLQSCPYTKDNYLNEGVDTIINRANLTIQKLDKEAPQLKNIQSENTTPLEGPERNQEGLSANSKYDLMYKGYGINIETEDVIDDDITIRRRYAMIFNGDNEVVEQTSPTYATKDSIIFNEAKFLIDTFNTTESPDANPSTVEDAEIEEMLGISLADVQAEQNAAQQGVQNLINEIVAEKDLQQKLEKEKKERERQKQQQQQQQSQSQVDPIQAPDPLRVRQVARFVKSLTVEDFYQIAVRKKSKFFFLYQGRSAGRELIRRLGGLEKNKNLSLVNAISTNVYRHKYNHYHFATYHRQKEDRLDRKNLASLIRFLLIYKKYTLAEIQAGLEMTRLGRIYNFEVKRKGITFKRIRGM